jgi:excisionase family DNA binding protein
MNVQEQHLLTARQVAARIGVSLRTIWRWTMAGDMPAPVRRGRRIVRWKTTDIQRFVKQMPVERRPRRCVEPQ